MAVYRNYLLAVLGAYVLLILLLHVQLQGFDKTKTVYSVESERESSRRVLNHGVMSVDSNEKQVKPNEWPLRFHTLDKPLPVGNQFMTPDNTKKAMKNQQVDSDGFHGSWNSYFMGPLGKIPNIKSRKTSESVPASNEKVMSNQSDKKGNRKPVKDQYLNKRLDNAWLEVAELKNESSSKKDDLKILQPIPDHCKKYIQATPGGQLQGLYQHYIYSAYYDDRETDYPVIRIMALLHKVNKPILYCHFGTASSIPRDINASDLIVQAEYYEMCENHAKEYGGWILSCEVPYFIDEMPCSVRIGVFPSDKLHELPKHKKKIVYSSVEVPIYTLGTNHSGENKNNFGVCIPPLFGNIPSMTLINFIELTKLLGADHLIFYNFQVSTEIKQVLQYYEDIGYVSVIKWTIPIRDKSIWYHGQLAAINDCLYRSMHQFKLVAFNDIDEFIIPRMTKTWGSLINLLTPPSVPSNHCGFSFQSAFFDPHITDAKPIVYDLETDLRTKVISKVRTKVVVDPMRVFELGIHHISRPLHTGYRVIYADPKIALLHHYRKCTSDFDPRMNCHIFVKDETLSGFIPALRYQVHQSLWKLKQRAEAMATRS